MSALVGRIPFGGLVVVMAVVHIAKSQKSCHRVSCAYFIISSNSYVYRANAACLEIWMQLPR